MTLSNKLNPKLFFPYTPSNPSKILQVKKREWLCKSLLIPVLPRHLINTYRFFVEPSRIRRFPKADYTDLCSKSETG